MNTDYPILLTEEARRIASQRQHCPGCRRAYDIMTDIANGRKVDGGDLFKNFPDEINAGILEFNARVKNADYQRWYNKQPSPPVGTTYETLPGGGRQTAEKDRYDLIPPESIEALARVHGEGAAKHGEGNWRNIPVGRHLGRALGHITRYLAGDRSEPHLEHALCRVNMAYALSITKSTKEPTEWRGQR